MAEPSSHDIPQDEEIINSHSNPENLDRPNSVNRGREDRVRLVRERQNEERLRKLNEIRQQALQAQRTREQKEEERRRRIEELRVRDTDRRQQVEERKRQIEDAERERREAIVRKNAEREARLETQRKGSRGLASSAVFAFGSSTPRLLEPSDTGGFWSHRRATSTTDMLMFGAGSSGAQSLSSGSTNAGGRRSSERDTDGGSKKRATSAGGLDRDPNEDETDPSSAHSLSQSMYSNRVARRKTDLMPTIPSPRDAMSTSFHHSRQPFTRSPGRAYSMSRLDQLSQPRRRTPELSVLAEQGRAVPHRPLALHSHSQKVHNSSGNGDISSSSNLSRSMSHLAAGSRPLRAVSMSHLAPVAPPRMNKTERMRRQRLAVLAVASSDTTGVRSGDVTPSRPGSALSGVSTSSAAGVVLRRPASAAPHHRSGPHRPRPASIAGVTGLSLAALKNSTSNSDIKSVGVEYQKPPIPHPRTKSQGKVERTPSKSVTGLKGTSSARGSARSTPLTSPSAENVGLLGSPQTSLSNGHKSTPAVPKRKSNKNETAEKPPFKNIGGSLDFTDLLGVHASEEINQTETVDVDTKAPVESETVCKAEINTESASTLMIDTTPKLNSVEEPKIDILNENTVNVPLDISLIEEELTETKHNIPENLSATFINEEKKVSEINFNPLPSINKVPEIELIDVLIDNELESTAKNETVIKNMSVSQPPPIMSQSIDLSDITDMTASTIAKNRITTEEEAKAALAERRRLAREEAERQAERERQRLAEEARIEEERQRAEEEEQRRLEEESLRLAKEQREAEETRLRQAIEEAQKREQEERKMREEEARQRAEREEAEKKAREEAERQRIELAEKLQKEEKEREARRKRVEAIMSRTRNRGSTGSATGTPVQSNNQDDRPSSAPDVNSRNTVDESTLVPEKNIVRNGTTGSEMSDNGIDSKKVVVVNENDNSQTQSPIIKSGELTVDNDFNPVSTNPQLIFISPKLPLNGSNIDNVVEQHNVRNANDSMTPTADVITNEDTINSNKSTLSETKSTSDPF